MVFTHDTEMSLQAAAVLVNTAEQPDTLTTMDQLDEWYDAWSFTGSRRGDDAELAAVRALRPVLRDLLTADRDRAAALVMRCDLPPRA